MKVFAIDPGTEQSAWVLWDGSLLGNGIVPNEELLNILYNTWEEDTHYCVEWIKSYGMAVGAEVFETCLWIGRFIQHMQPTPGLPRSTMVKVPRQDVKLHICQSPKATDANIRLALIDRIGPVGKKATPGPLFGVTSHSWAALALAVTFHDRLTSDPFVSFG